jgi:hypothetical protein
VKKFQQQLINLFSHANGWFSEWVTVVLNQTEKTNFALNFPPSSRNERE